MSNSSHRLVNMPKKELKEDAISLICADSFDPVLKWRSETLSYGSNKNKVYSVTCHLTSLPTKAFHLWKKKQWYVKIYAYIFGVLYAQMRGIGE